MDPSHSMDFEDHQKAHVFIKTPEPNNNDFDDRINFESAINMTHFQFVDNIDENEKKESLSLLNFGNEINSSDHQPLSLQEELQLLNEKLEEHERKKSASYVDGKYVLSMFS